MPWQFIVPADKYLDFMCGDCAEVIKHTERVENTVSGDYECPACGSTYLMATF